MQFFKLFISTFFCITALDMLWLGILAKNLYDQQIGGLLRKAGGVMDPNWFSACAVYIAIITGILCFVLPKANGQLLLALGWGAVFGAVTYGIYDFTNFAILANWPLTITLIDFVWGIVLCGLTSTFAAAMQNWLKS